MVILNSAEASPLHRRGYTKFGFELNCELFSNKQVCSYCYPKAVDALIEMFNIELHESLVSSDSFSGNALFNTVFKICLK